MIIEIKIPSPGESITEVELSNWMVDDGDFVEKDQEIAEIESDKATLPLVAEEEGKIKIKIQEGETVRVDEVACEIDTSSKREKKDEPKNEKKNGDIEEAKEEDNIEKPVKQENKKIEKVNKKGTKEKPATRKEFENIKISPVAKKLMEENNLSVEDIIKGLKRISKKDIEMVTGMGTLPDQPKEASREEKREKMSALRKKLSTRLVSVKNDTAMLTTFNEVNMSAIIALRKKYQKEFVEKHEIKLGFMSFFTKAVVEALKAYPKVNSQIDEEEIVSPQYYDIGIAVQTDKGLMVPIIRNAEMLELAEIEKQIADLAGKARKFRISMEEMTGGTFTITNGGIFGSLLSTPILNPPQSAILGMHNIVERPIAVNGKVEIAPMMYVALSYDHRIIDGKDSVSFLVKLKELLEEPTNLLTGGNTDKVLLGL